MRKILLLLGLAVWAHAEARADDGYDLWLRYRPRPGGPRTSAERAALARLDMPSSSPALRAAREELLRGVRGMLGERTLADAGRGALLAVGTPASSPTIAALPLARELPALGRDGFVIRQATVRGRPAMVIAAGTDIGVLYGVFRFLEALEQARPLASLEVRSVPAVPLRMLDHWDNLDRSIERGYAGRSLWEWDSLPARVSPRYRDYARANASIGINGSVLTNVNASAQVLTAPYLTKTAAIADVFRPYGIRVYLTARFSAPIEIGGLTTADPIDPRVRAWWARKADEVYAVIPDFGGFLVKANSEGQPGPQDYHRSHADGANMLADALAPHGGIVIWRAFVYGGEVPADRVKQAYDEFAPLDGHFRDNVLVQVKNGPLDFQPREPFHPLFGAMPETPLLLELQVTKEYLGQDTHLVFLGPLFEEVLRADTWRAGAGSTVAQVLAGTRASTRAGGVAGVANIGTDRDWTGSIFNQANWYALGRMAWEPTLDASAVVDEWARMTFSPDTAVASPIRRMMLASREAVVNYMTPLGLAHIMATDHHYGPGAWAAAGRPEWTPSYYHRADSIGLGFDRTARGSNAVSQYAPPVRARFQDVRSTPDSLLLWFHHVAWSERLASGRTLWEELAYRYHAGVDTVRAMRRTWQSLRPAVDAERFAAVDGDLAIQEREARWWADATLQYFQTFSRQPIPPRYEPPAHTLDYYRRLHCPADPTKPRCPDVP